jgi:hypothetical protein
LELGSETTEEIAICIIGEIIKVSKEKMPMKVKQLNRYVKRRKAYFSTFLTCCKERFYIPEIHSYDSKDVILSPQEPSPGPFVILLLHSKHLIFFYL